MSKRKLIRLEKKLRLLDSMIRNIYRKIQDEKRGGGGPNPKAKKREKLTWIQHTRDSSS